MKKAPNNPSVLDVYLAKVRAKPEVSPGLDADAPPVGGDGDPRYAVGPELGRGGSASVLLGVDRHLRRTVAIKVLPESDRRDPDIVQAFLEEAVITGGLTHPNIVPAFDLSYSEEIGLYYTMRRLTGRSLERVLADLRHGDEHARRVFTPFKLLGIFVDICRAVAYAHSRGVIHTDLKPANVLVGEQAEVAVADWGLAQVVGPDGQRQARARLMGGTPSYMSPEQIDSPSTDLDQQADVWSLGVILYELLTLTRPFTATTVPGIFAAIARGHVVPPSDRAPERGVPRALDPVVLRALQRDKAQRYATVKELLADVEDWMEGTRERMRRVEEARAAAERARAGLDGLALAERALDHTTITDTPERLAALRAELAAGYGRAQAAIFQGLAALDDDEHLHELAGDLYWRAFRRLLSPAIAANDRALASTSLELLGALSERALPAIVHEGKKRLGAEPATASAVDDPWLSTVVAFCATEERLEPSAAVTSRLVARVAFLKKVPLFTRMPSADLLPIAAACDEVDVAPGAVIFDEGAVGSSLYVVLEGTVDIVKGDARLNTLAPGDVFGEVAVLAESTRTAKAVARGAVRCVVLEGQRFREIVRKNGDIGLAVIQVLTERLRVATEREAQLRASLTPPT